MSNIAVFGGTFNPIHSEHVKMIEHLSTLDFIDKVLVIPTHTPPHKAVGYLAGDEHRINMCRLATEGIGKVSVSDFEIKRQGKSYTFYTVEALKKAYANDKIYIVCGGDMAITLDTWHRYNELKKLCTFLVVDRPGTDKDKLRVYLNALQSDGAEIEYTCCVTDDVSSTFIRSNIENGKFVPEKVYAYIKENGLYEAE